MSMPRSFGNTRSRSMKSAASHRLRKYQKHEIGAIAAAFGNGDMFTVIDPNGAETLVALGEKPLLFRGSIAVAGRKRPLRHLVACSQELAATSSDGKLLLMTTRLSGPRWSAITDY